MYRREKKCMLGFGAATRWKAKLARQLVKEFLFSLPGWESIIVAKI